MFIRSPYNYDVRAASLAGALYCDLEDSLTQQSFKEECDINTIVDRFGLTGKMPDNPRLPSYGDFTDVKDFASAMRAIREAEEGFMELPADLRFKFGNDPQSLLMFLENPENRDDAVKLGLVNKPVEVPRDVVTAVDDLAKILTKPTA